MKNFKENSGFTLIELILVIAILGLLAIAALPQFVNIAEEAEAAAEQGVTGSVRDGIAMQFGETLATTGSGAFPSSLDKASNGPCIVGNECFTNVLQYGVSDGKWTKSGLIYTGPTGTSYTYSPETGTFQ